MSLIPRSSLFDFDNFFDHFVMRPVASENAASFFAPRIDIKDNESHYLISAELPGVKKEDIHLSLANGVLTLEAESKQEDKEEKEGKVIRQERRYGKIMRSFNIGNNVHESDVTAEFADGVLSLKAPKVEEKVEATQRIEIK